MLLKSEGKRLENINKPIMSPEFQKGGAEYDTRPYGIDFSCGTFATPSYT